MTGFRLKCPRASFSTRPPWLFTLQRVPCAPASDWIGLRAGLSHDGRTMVLDRALAYAEISGKPNVIAVAGWTIYVVGDIK
jgi:hypothetical protein